MAGNGPIGLEILDDLPGVEAVLVPFGGGGLSCDIASALRQSGSDAPVHPVEVSTSAKVSAAFAEGAAAVDRDGSQLRGRDRRQHGARTDVAVRPETPRRAARGLARRDRRRGAPPRRARPDRRRRRRGLPGRGRGSRPGARAGRKLVAVVSGGNMETGVFRRILAGENPRLRPLTARARAPGPDGTRLPFRAAAPSDAPGSRTPRWTRPTASGARTTPCRRGVVGRPRAPTDTNLRAATPRLREGGRDPAERVGKASLGGVARPRERDWNRRRRARCRPGRGFDQNARREASAAHPDRLAPPRSASGPGPRCRPERTRISGPGGPGSSSTAGSPG